MDFKHNFLHRSHDETSTKRLRKLVQKLANDAEISFLRQTLDKDMFHLLSKINDEATRLF